MQSKFESQILGTFEVIDGTDLDLVREARNLGLLF
jgi:hypothetical protein